jgi:hypothetical protein
LIDQPATFPQYRQVSPIDPPYQLLADAVLAVHVAIVVFVVAGLFLVILGNVNGWHWVNRRLFRYAHLAAIAIVLAQAWLGRICPLTVLEMTLRRAAGSETYPGSFVQYWLQRLLYYDAPQWVFLLAYSAFGALVAACWWYFPPDRARRGPGTA